MKQTAMTISINSSVNNNQNGEQRMTSLEIAQLSGKQHKDVLKAIRVDYKDQKGELRPCYLLSKTECLYIATKFNDEARAKLVIRWQELEEERLMEIQKPKQKIQEIRLLACDEEVLDEADDILGEELEELNRESRYCYTPTEIGKAFGLDGRDLNSFLSDQKIIRWARGQWQLTQKYLHRELTANRYSYVHGRDGRRKLVSRLVWTEKGREFIMDMIKR